MLVYTKAEWGAGFHRYLHWASGSTWDRFPIRLIVNYIVEGVKIKKKWNEVTQDPGELTITRQLSAGKVNV